MNPLEIRETKSRHSVEFACYDVQPGKLAWREAYGLIRAWFQKNKWRILTETSEVIHQDGTRKPWGGDLQVSLNIIEDIEQARTLFEEVRIGHLEWGFWQTDGDFPMKAYAHAGLDYHKPD
jgi:hypothetical protein